MPIRTMGTFRGWLGHDIERRISWIEISSPICWQLDVKTASPRKLWFSPLPTLKHIASVDKLSLLPSVCSSFLLPLVKVDTFKPQVRIRPRQNPGDSWPKCCWRGCSWAWKMTPGLINGHVSWYNQFGRVKYDPLVDISHSSNLNDTGVFYKEPMSHRRVGSSVSLASQSNPNPIHTVWLLSTLVSLYPPFQLSAHSTCQSSVFQTSYIPTPTLQTKHQTYDWL